MRSARSAGKQPTATKRRALPRAFEMHWGSGQIVEEASWTGRHHEPAVQLMQYDDGEAAGSVGVRFCFYNLSGQFQRGALIVDEEALEGLRQALKTAPRLRTLLKRLVS